MKTKKIKAWAVICNLKTTGTFAYTDKRKAFLKKSELNKEFSGCCKHKIIPCEIVIEAVNN